MVAGRGLRRRRGARGGDVMDWQPIETAPKDGTAVLVWPPSKPGTMTCAVWASRHSPFARLWPYWRRLDVSGHERSRDLPPTHWAPLPPGPVGA
jgi:hypothetical protein